MWLRDFTKNLNSPISAILHLQSLQQDEETSMLFDKLYREKQYYRELFIKPQSSTSWRSSLELLRLDGNCTDKGSPGLYKDGDTPRTSPRGFTSFIIEGFHPSLRFPLHDAVRRDGGGTKLVPCAISPVFLCIILSMLGNRCRLIDDDVDFCVEEIESSLNEVGGLALFREASCMLSSGVWTVSTTEATGAGMKNLGLEPPPGLAAGIEGVWNKFDGVPPPLLNVSTYLKKLK